MTLPAHYNPADGIPGSPATIVTPEPDPLHEQMCQLANEIEDDDVAERLIALAAKVRTLESTDRGGR